MAYPEAGEFHSNKVPMFIQEGSFTESDRDVMGGYYADEVTLSGIPVSIVTNKDMTVTASAAAGSPIGMTFGLPWPGESTDDPRVVTVELFGDGVKEIELHTSSDTVAAGTRMKFKGPGGKYGKGVWEADTASAAAPSASAAYRKTVIALASSSTTGSIASGSVIKALFGAW